MKIAGRCDCGFILDWVFKASDEHLRCLRLRWCPACGEVAAINRHCLFCRRVIGSAYMRRQREANSIVYERNKTAKRKKYASDPVYRAKCQTADKQQKARRRWPRRISEVTA